MKLGSIALALLAAAVAAHAAVAQTPGRRAAESLRYPRLSFQPPEAELKHVDGTPVLFLEDRSVPLVTLFARLKGGYALFDRDSYAAGTALPSLLRYGGTTTMTPDSVDESLEYYAIQTTFGGGGESIFTSLNTLTEHLPTAMRLWRAMLREPRFDSLQLEVWRGRELESVRRRPDDPQRLAFSEFNRLLYGDHPVGWEMEEADLAPDRFTPARLQDLHRRIVCPENLTLGATGDVSWSDLEPMFREFLESWPECSIPLPEPKIPEIRRDAGVYVIPRELEQAVLVMAHPTDVRLSENPSYFSAQIGNSILGGGGFSSRILSRVRTEEGYAYSASSLWTMPRRYEGILGAITRTRPENAVPALRLILDIMEEMRDAPPEQEEVETAVAQIVNGFVFNFETRSQIVARRMFYLAQDLPDDWLERYVSGVQRVTPESVRRVFRRHLRPEQMTILVVGDPQRIGMSALESLGPVTLLELSSPGPTTTSEPPVSGSR
jgi:predicted Zn-dependent peptidase